MNEHEIDEAIARHRSHVVLSKATQFLAAFRDEVNAHSDGWPYWSAPVHSAAKLMTLIQNPHTATEAAFKASLKPIRAFYTRKGNAAGMKWPIPFTVTLLTVDRNDPPTQCPFCCSCNISSVVEWTATSMNPTDKGNTAELMEWQCQSQQCQGRSFWC